MRNVFFVLLCFVFSCQANAKLAKRSQDLCATWQLQKCKREIALSRCCEGLIFGRVDLVVSTKKKKPATPQWLVDERLTSSPWHLSIQPHSDFFPPLIYPFFHVRAGDVAEESAHFVVWLVLLGRSSSSELSASAWVRHKHVVSVKIKGSCSFFFVFFSSLVPSRWASAVPSLTHTSMTIVSFRCLESSFRYGACVRVCHTSTWGGGSGGEGSGGVGGEGTQGKALFWKSKN